MARLGHHPEIFSMLRIVESRAMLVASASVLGVH